MTRAPASEALSRVESVESASITKISSAQATDSQASLMFDSSLKVMIVALIFIRFGEAQNKFAIASVSVSYLSNRELKTPNQLCRFVLWNVRRFNNYIVGTQRSGGRTLEIR